MANTWIIDPAHSEITFKVKHLMIATVTGQFKQFDLKVETEADDFQTTRKVDFSAAVNSIDTNNPQRDEHLKSADFFSAGEYPELRFSGTDYEVKDGEVKLKGNLTIRDTTRPITLNAELGGVALDPYGQTKAGFTVSGQINRKDFGLTWGAVTEAGNVVVGDEIKINAEVQLIKQA